MTNIQTLPEHAALWQRFSLNQADERLSQAILLIGSLHLGLDQLAEHMAAAILCKQASGSCEGCQSCRLVSLNEHPDLMCLLQEKPGSVIKIEQVRALHNIIYTSPQLSAKRVVIINPAEKLNLSASNALLKILEEPPSDCYFILVAEQLSTIPSTIISRCQLWRTPTSASLQQNPLAQGSYYSPDSERGKLFVNLELIIDELMALQSTFTVNALAAKWSTYEFNELIWLMYLITAQMIQEGLGVSTSDYKKLSKLAKGIGVAQLFTQVDKLNEIINNLNHTLSINQLLVLEDLLLGYCFHANAGKGV